MLQSSAINWSMGSNHESGGKHLMFLNCARKQVAPTVPPSIGRATLYPYFTFPKIDERVIQFSLDGKKFWV